MKKKRKHRNRVTKLFLTVLTMIVAGFVYSFGVATFENIKVNQEIKAFKARGIYQETVYRELRSTPTETIIQETRIYVVPRETSAELNDTKNVGLSANYMSIGTKGDIFVTPQSPFPHIPVFHQFMSYNFGGHAAINNGENGHIESTGYPAPNESIWDIITDSGNNDGNYSVTVNDNPFPYMLGAEHRKSDPEFDFYGYNYRTKMVGLRVKGVTEGQIDKAVDFASSLVDKNIYNFLYFLNTANKYYCTDLVSRAYQSAMVSNHRAKHYSRVLNDDGFITSVSDLILSKDTYIHYYIEIIDGIMHIYYLEDVN